MEKSDFESQCWALMQDQINKIDERTKDLPAIRTLLEGVLEQTTKTNGTVRGHQTWIDKVSGGWKLAAIVWTIFNSAVVMGAITYFWNLQQRITADVIDGLETRYNIDITDDYYGK